MNIIFLIGLCTPLISAPLRVVCFGDSTTAPRANVIPYCEQLAQEFSPDRAIFINRGVPGNTTADASTRFERDVLQAKPDVVFIQFGINDSTVDVWKTPPATGPRVSIANYRENLASFMEALQKHGTQVVLMTFNPLSWATKTRELYSAAPYNPALSDSFNQGRDIYLDEIRALARKSGAILLDVNAAFRKNGKPLNDLLLDGIHPNTDGQRITAELARPVIVKLLQARQHAH